MDRQALWDKCVAFHGHACGGLTIGFQAARYAMELLELDFSADEDVVCITENDACGVDAIQVLLGCSVGKGNLLFHLRGKQAFSFYNRKTGKAVRLVQGDYNQMTVFSDRPEKVALGFKEQGAKNLHVVDLDGAKDAALANFDTIEKLIKTTGLFVEVGGGIRNEASIDKYLSLGAGRVILGTVAVTNYPFVEEMVRKYGDKIAVGVDAKDGFVATHGWLETSEVRGVDFCRRLRDTGVKTVIYTDISRDGKMQGTNLELYKELSQIEGLDIVASGGISSLKEIEILKNEVYGAILGKALYLGAIDLKEALKYSV
mgnify:FL=1